MPYPVEMQDSIKKVEAKLVYRPVIKSLARIKSWPVEDILITSSAW